MSQLFKGIALFTPGGDLVYCLDRNKQRRWHAHLCVGLQEILNLSEPPHFLVPGYTATVDRWFDSQSQQFKTSAEVYPAVQRYQPLLDRLFDDRGDLPWQTASWQEEFCNPLIIETYRDLFPQLWQSHDLIVRLDFGKSIAQDPESFTIPKETNLDRVTSEQNFLDHNIPTIGNYILHLFVSGHQNATEEILQNLYQVLEQGLGYPYTLKVIDVSQNPEQAEIEQVIATPTLVRVSPQPVLRIIGELADRGKIIDMLTHF